MARYIISLYCIVFLFWQLILINFTEARDEILEGMIKDGETEIHLKWKKTNHLLANENLPVWLANIHSLSSCRFSPNSVKHDLKKNFMKDHVGKFTLYHDIEKLSAVVYFENTKTLHGMIDTRYMIYGMPIDECNQGHQVGGNYVKRSEEKMDIHDYLKRINYPIYRNEKSGAFSGEISSASDDEFETPRKRERVQNNGDEGQVTTLYPEVLVFIPYDTITHVKNIGQKKTSIGILRHFIVYFNAVDMLLAKLSTDNIKIHLNLAGIVFEGKSNVFNFMVPIDAEGPPSASPGLKRYVKYDSTVQQISNYINNNLDTFPENSFDYFFVPFGMKFWSNGKIAEAVSENLNYYDSRKTPLKNRNRLGLMINQGGPCEFIIAAHEMGHLMGIKHESWNKGFRTYMSQCYAIMQEVGQYCIDCIKWTEENIVDLKRFVKENQNRCFLLNEPRSLHPHGHRMKMLSRLEQCQCYGFQHWPIKDLEDHIDEVPQNGCDQLMICGENSQVVNTILPFDGTSCATNKVCWNQKCEPISHGSPFALQGPSN